MTQACSAQDDTGLLRSGCPGESVTTVVDGMEAGSLSMQRQIGVPSALVVVIEGLTMLFILAATVRRA